MPCTRPEAPLQVADMRLEPFRAEGGHQLPLGVAWWIGDAVVAERQAKPLLPPPAAELDPAGGWSLQELFHAPGHHRRTRLRSPGSPAMARMPIFVQGALHGVNETRLGIDDARGRDRCQPAPGPRRDARARERRHRRLRRLDGTRGALVRLALVRAESCVIPDYARDPDAYIYLIDRKRRRRAPPASADPVPLDGTIEALLITPGTTSSGWSRWRWRRRRRWPPRSTSGRPGRGHEARRASAAGGDRTNAQRGRRRAG